MLFEPPPLLSNAIFSSCLPQCNEQENDDMTFMPVSFESSLKDASCEQNLFEFLALAAQHYPYFLLGVAVHLILSKLHKICSDDS